MSTVPTEGERRRDAALDLLAARRAVYVRRGQRALLLRLLGGVDDTATADDVRAAVPLPEDVDPRCLGGVPRPLAQAEIVRHAGYRPTRRPERHAAPTAVWELADRAAAWAWLASHPDMPDPTSDDPGVQPTWWD